MVAVVAAVVVAVAVVVVVLVLGQTDRETKKRKREASKAAPHKLKEEDKEEKEEKDEAAPHKLDRPVVEGVGADELLVSLTVVSPCPWACGPCPAEPPPSGNGVA